jgi:RNA polymerase sigma-70 factor (ECF subfamily)
MSQYGKDVPAAAEPAEGPGWERDGRGVGARIDELVGPARQGDERALTELMRLLRPLVVSYCANRLHGSSVSPEDVTQEVCVAILRALPAYRERGRPFLAFVHTVASHRIATACGSAVRTHEWAVADPPDTAAACDRADQPEQHALDTDDSDRVGRLLRRLPERSREILVLRVVWGLSAKETGRLLGIRPESVRLQQYRALLALRRMLVCGPDARRD